MAVDVQDPRITRAMMTGYPHPVENPVKKDFFGNEIYPGDEIIVFEDEVFLADGISLDLKEFLEKMGGHYKTA